MFADVCVWVGGGGGMVFAARSNGNEERQFIHVQDVAGVCVCVCVMCLSVCV
jgi:nucleoside-diphosphate-sugar epimerase